MPVHGPIHASWLNQIEIYFSIVQRKVLIPNDFLRVEDVKERLAALPGVLRVHGNTLRLALHARRSHPKDQIARPASECRLKSYAAEFMNRRTKSLIHLKVTALFPREFALLGC